MVAAGHRVGAAAWATETDGLLDRMAGRFGRVETRRRAGRFVRGLLAELPRKNCWSIAEHAGDRDPHGMQHFLARASWDTDGVRDDLRDYVIGALGDADGVLVVDETGDVKKGSMTVGVQRQYTGTAGRIENAQVAVYLAYAGPHGHAMIDRELYLPTSWTDDPRRLADAGVPDDIEFLTKPALATGMLTRALQAGVPARWVAGDEVYGVDPGLRTECELHRIGYVLAIGCDRRIPTTAGPIRADELAAGLPRWAWQRLSAGSGAKGERYYDWAWIAHPDPAHPDPAHPDAGTRWTRSGGRCWSAVTATPGSWPSTAATPHSRCRCGSWSASLGAAGPWRSRSRPARAWPDSTNTRSAAGPPGGGGRCWRCSPTRCSRCSPCASTPTARHPPT